MNKFELLFHTQVNTPYVQSIDGERLSDDLLNFSENMKLKRIDYFENALTLPLENIRYVTLSVKREVFEDIGEWYSSEEECHSLDSEIDD